MTQDLNKCPYRLEWMSDEQYECFGLYADLVGGFHHVMAEPKPAGIRGIEINVRSSRWATYDFDGLTRAVILAHDRAIRLEIAPSGPGRLKFFIHKRQRDGRMYERHPTIEDAISNLRGHQ